MKAAKSSNGEAVFAELPEPGAQPQHVKVRIDDFLYDAVLICASIRSESLINQGIRFLRKRGSVIIDGDTGCEFGRNLLLRK